MNNIPLHPKRGLDPHLTYCQRCGGEASELTVGDVRKITNTGEGTDHGKVAYANRGETRKLADKLGWNNYSVDEIPEGERLPASEPCEGCREELAKFKAVVEDGGVYWSCKECHQSGVIKPSDYANAVRKSAGVEKPKPVGVAFDVCKDHATQEQSDVPTN